MCLSVANRHRIKADGRIELVFGTEAFFSPRALRYKNKYLSAAHHRICRSTASRSPVLTRGGICVPPTVTYLPYRVSGSTLTDVGRSQLLARWPGTHSRILSGIQRAAQTVLGVYLKSTCSRATSVSSALGVLNDYALYKSTHSLTHPLQKIRGFCSELWTLKLRHDHRNMLST